MFPLVPLHAVPRPVIEQAGNGLAVTLLELLALQPLLPVTVTVKLTGLAPLAFQVILAVPAPAVIVPLLTVQV